MKLEELEEKYKELGVEIERLKSDSKKEIWKPKREDKYYYPDIKRWDGIFSNSGTVDYNTPTKSFAIFQTKEECDNFCKIIEAIAELKAWQKVYGSGNWFIGYYIEKLDYIPMLDWIINKTTINIDFASEEACQEIIPQLSENCKAYLRGEYS